MVYDSSLLRMYIILNVFLIIFSVYIFFRVTPDLAKKIEFIFFRVFLVAFQFYLVMNSLWTLQEYDAIQMPRALFVTVCMASYISVAFNAFCFYAFSMIRFDLGFGKRVWSSLLGTLPFFAAIVLLCISLWNGMIFSVTEDNNVVTGPAYLALAGCSFLYFVVIVRVSIMKAMKVRTYYAKKDALSTTLAVVFLVVWVIIDGFFDKITIIPIAIFSVILVLFVSLLQSNVYTDALTQMNNRRRTEEYLTGLIEGLSEAEPMYIYIVDINHFKRINDNYGHTEGDAVLVLFATALKEVVAERGGFAARYGGDEFVLAWSPQKESEFGPQDFLDEIKKRVVETCKRENKPYDISFSCGFVRCTDPGKKFGVYFKEADEMMYRNKHLYHAAHN